MSDTPRTQKARGFHDLETAVAAKEMEKLERELNTAKAALSGRTVSCSNCNALAEENAELKNAADIISGRESELIAKYCYVREENAEMRAVINGVSKILRSIQLNDIFEETMRNHAVLALSRIQPYLK